MKNKYLLFIALTIFSLGFTPIVAQTVQVVPFINDGGRMDWAVNGIAYDFLDSTTGYYEMGLINPDGTGFTNLTKGVANIPQKNNGNPACYYPNGRYIVYEAEKDSNYSPADAYYGKSANATPGIGLNVDLWVVDLQTMAFTRLTDLPTKRSRTDTTPISGILHPQFSHDGRKLLWSECINVDDTSRGTALPGLWELNISDFDTTGGVPSLTNTINYQTGGALGDFTFLETSGGFSPDDSTVIYCANAIPGQLAGYMDIWSFNIYTQQLTDLTPDSNVWDEHSHYTHDGNSILWMNSEGYAFVDDVTQVPRTDYWMMDKSGNNKKQVTFYNTPDSAEYISVGGNLVTVGDAAWSPFGGDTAVCYVQIFSHTSATREICYLIGVQQSSVATGVSSIIKDGFNLYPNPAESKVTIDLSGLGSASAYVKVYGINGDLAYEEAISNTQIPNTIQTGSLAKGLYFVQVVSGDLVWNKKLVIE
jgi:hypothetical protein